MRRCFSLKVIDLIIDYLSEGCEPDLYGGKAGNAAMGGKGRQRCSLISRSPPVILHHPCQSHLSPERKKCKKSKPCHTGGKVKRNREEGKEGMGVGYKEGEGRDRVTP